MLPKNALVRSLFIMPENTQSSEAHSPLGTGTNSPFPAEPVHFLVGVRRWYVMRYSSDSFIIFTEAYERPRGQANYLGVDRLFGREISFSIWDRDLLNVVQFVKNYNAPSAKWGKPVNQWVPIPGQTNQTGNPWINSLQPALQPTAKGK